MVRLAIFVLLLWFSGLPASAADTSAIVVPEDELLAAQVFIHRWKSFSIFDWDLLAALVVRRGCSAIVELCMKANSRAFGDHCVRAGPVQEPGPNPTRDSCIMGHVRRDPVQQTNADFDHVSECEFCVPLARLAICLPVASRFH